MPFNNDGPNSCLSAGHIKEFEHCDQYQLMVDDFALACQIGREAEFSDSRLLTSILGKIVNQTL